LGDRGSPGARADRTRVGRRRALCRGTNVEIGVRDHLKYWFAWLVDPSDSRVDRFLSLMVGLRF